MIIDLPSTTTSAVNKKMVDLRESGGAVALGRVLTMVIVTGDGTQTEEAIEAANDASREHPCRVIVVARGARQAAARLDAQIRIGGDAGASEVVVLRLYGPLADEGAGCVVPLLLPDAPVVVWWPTDSPEVPSRDPIGALAHRRITDAAAADDPIAELERRRKSYVEGDTDLAWTRLTTWRALLAATLDLPPHEKVTAATVTGESDSPSSDLLAGWLAIYLHTPVWRVNVRKGEGIVSASLERRSGNVQIVRPDGQTGTVTQPGQPERRVALRRREVRDCLAEELRRLDPDEIYEAALTGLARIERAEAGATAGSGAEPSDSKSSDGESRADSTATTSAPASGKGTGKSSSGQSGGKRKTTKSSAGKTTDTKRSGAAKSTGKASSGSQSGGAGSTGRSTSGEASS